MANSQHLALRDVVVALLLAGPPVFAGRVYANRDYKLAADAPSGVWVYRDDSTPTRGPMMASPIDWATRLRVVVKARTAGAVPAETAADTAATEVYARIMSQPFFAAAVSDVEAGPITWQQDDAETAVAQCELEFLVQHRTSNNLLT